MSLYALLTLDLHGADTDQRTTFNEYMRAKNWTKLAVSTAWTATFSPPAIRSGVIQATRTTVAAAAAAAGITSYQTALQVGLEAAVKVEP